MSQPRNGTANRYDFSQGCHFCPLRHGKRITRRRNTNRSSTKGTATARLSTNPSRKKLGHEMSALTLTVLTTMRPAAMMPRSRVSSRSTT